MKKFFSLLMVSAMALSMVACGSDGSSATTAKEGADKSYNVGVVQLVQHPALDAATEGFQAAIEEKLEGATVTVENAAGDSATCSTIANQFVADRVDLIMANATPALQAAVTATPDIPIVGTSVTDYATALSIDDWKGVTGMNVTGTADLAPLDGQADMLKELFPDAKNVGIIYCSAEPNSLYQSNTITGYLEKAGYTVKTYTFADTNDVASVVKAACSESDVLYVPTDNTAASCAETINGVALPAGKPIIAGEEGICAGCGVATLSIDYYDIGYQAGLMAVEILQDGKDPSTMKIQYAPKFEKKYNKDICDQLGVEVTSDYVAIEAE